MVSPLSPPPPFSATGRKSRTAKLAASRLPVPLFVLLSTLSSLNRSVGFSPRHSAAEYNNRSVGFSPRIPAPIDKTRSRGESPKTIVPAETP